MHFQSKTWISSSQKHSALSGTCWNTTPKPDRVDSMRPSSGFGIIDDVAVDDSMN